MGDIRRVVDGGGSVPMGSIVLPRKAALPVGKVSAFAFAWRQKGELRVTVVSKAAFADDAVMARVEALPRRAPARSPAVRAKRKRGLGPRPAPSQAARSPRSPTRSTWGRLPGRPRRSADPLAATGRVDRAREGAAPHAPPQRGCACPGRQGSRAPLVCRPSGSPSFLFCNPNKPCLDLQES